MTIFELACASLPALEGYAYIYPQCLLRTGKLSDTASRYFFRACVYVQDCTILPKETDGLKLVWLQLMQNVL